MSDYRIIVAGGRDFNDKEYLERSLNLLLEELDDVEIVSGHASGADKMAEEYAFWDGQSKGTKNMIEQA